MKKLITLSFILLLSFSYSQSNKSILYQGLDLEKDGKTEEALKKYNKVIEKGLGGKVGVMAYYYRANLYRKKYETNKSRADYKMAAKIAEDDKVIDSRLLGDLYYNYGLMQYQGFDYEGAEKSFGKCIEANSSDYSAYAFRALIRYELKNKVGACEDFSKAKKLKAGIVEEERFKKAYKKTKKKCN